MVSGAKCDETMEDAALLMSAVTTPASVLLCAI